MTKELRSGMIGLGNMGGRIARRIADAGLSVVGYDVRESRAEQLGIAAAGSIGKLVNAADIVFLSLPDSAVVERVVYSDDGVLDRSSRGQTVVDLSTADPSSSTAIAEKLAEKGVGFLDAGISGGAAAAERGELTIMVGGDGRTLDAVGGILQTFSRSIHHMGGPGAGHTTKLLNNFLNGVSLAATAEVMVAARKAGLDLSQVLDVINRSSGANFATQNRFPRVIEGDYLEGGLTNALMAKDLRLYLRVLQRLGVTSFSGPSCLGVFDLAGGLGYADQISNRVVDAIGDMAGGIRLHPSAERSNE